MNKKSSSKASQTDWQRIRAMQDEDIDLSDIPEVTRDQIARATLRVGGRPVPKGKVRVNMYLDAEVVTYYKAVAIKHSSTKPSKPASANATWKPPCAA